MKEDKEEVSKSGFLFKGYFECLSNSMSRPYYSKKEGLNGEERTS